MFFFGRWRAYRTIWRMIWNSGIGPEVTFGMGLLLNSAFLYLNAHKPMPHGELVGVLVFCTLLMGIGSMAGLARAYVNNGGALGIHQVELDPEAAVRLQRGKTLCSHRDWLEAVREFNVALEISPCAELYHWRAVAHQRSGANKAAIKDLRHAIREYRQEGLAGHAAALEQILR